MAGSAVGPSNIIKHDHLEKVKSHMLKVNEALRESELANRAGIGNPDNHAKLEEVRDKLLKFKQVYFPGH